LTSAVSRKSCTLFWQFNMADNIEEFLNKSDYRNPKSVLFSRRMPQTIPKSECHKFKTNADYYLDLLVFFEIWIFVIRVCFEFTADALRTVRYSNLRLEP
jgi:hypothetical protein